LPRSRLIRPAVGGQTEAQLLGAYRGAGAGRQNAIDLADIMAAGLSFC
jgi:hypothetical protein